MLSQNPRWRDGAKIIANSLWLLAGLRHEVAQCWRSSVARFCDNHGIVRQSNPDREI